LNGSYGNKNPFAREHQQLLRVLNDSQYSIESINYTDPNADLSTAWSKLTLNPDLFYGTGIWNKSMHFTRYYKNDWQGLVTQVTGFMQHQIFTLDCRNNVDKIDEIIKAIKDLVK